MMKKFCCLMIVFTIVTNAFADGGGQEMRQSPNLGLIYGTVSGDGDFALVAAYNADGSSVSGQVWDFFTPLNYTVSSNMYTIRGISAGTYDLQVYAPGCVYKIYEDVEVPSSGRTFNIALEKEGILTGKVTGSDGTTAVNEAIVIAKFSDDLSLGGYSEPNGYYTIRNLPEGTCQVSVYSADCLFATVANVAISSGSTTTQNFTGSDGSITGAITDHSNTALANVDLILTNSSNELYGSAKSAANGTYTFGSLPAGTYKLMALIDKALAPIHDNISVVNGQTTTANLQTAGGAITGTVTKDGQAVAGATIKTLNNSNGTYTEATTNSSGEYTSRYLPADNYSVGIYKSGNIALMNSNVTVTANQTTTGINFQLSSSGAVTGVVRDENQNGIKQIGVFACKSTLNDPDNETLRYFTAVTSDSGSYSIDWLPAGTYTVRAMDPNGHFVSDSATSVSVTVGQTTSNINFALGTTGATITGIVYSYGGTVPKKAIVTASADGGSCEVRWTADNGTYSIPHLKAGTYTLEAVDENGKTAQINNIQLVGTGVASGLNLVLSN